MRSLYWKICGTFLVVVFISLVAGAKTYHSVWRAGWHSWFEERWTRQGRTWPPSPSYGWGRQSSGGAGRFQPGAWRPRFGRGMQRTSASRPGSAVTSATSLPSGDVQTAVSGGRADAGRGSASFGWGRSSWPSMFSSGRLLARSLRALAGLAAREAAEALDSGAAPGAAAARLEELARAFTGISIVYASADGTPHGQSSPRARELLDSMTSESSTDSSDSTDSTTSTTDRAIVLKFDRNAGHASAPVPGGRGFVLVTAEVPSTFEPAAPEEMNRFMAQAAAAAIVVIFLVAAALGLLVFRTITRRLSRLGECLSGVAEGNLACRVTDPGTDEIGDLGRSFNTMAQRLENVVKSLEEIDERRRNFLADVSHELRTPLTTVQVSLESILESRILPPGGRGQADEPTVAEEVPAEKSTATTALQLSPDAGSFLRESLRICQEEANHVSSLVDDLLELARMDSPRYTLDRKDSVLQRIAADCVGRLKTALENRSIRVVTHFAPEPVRRDVDARRIGQALTNLLTNSIRSLDEGGIIEVVVEERDGRARIEIADDGPGISPADAEHVFERFRSGHRGGTGLGLSIVKRIVEAHGGRVGLEPREGRGTRATIEL